MELFTKDEAELTCKMQLGYSSLTDFTRNMADADKKAVENRMETMAAKGLLMAEKRGSDKYYKVPPLVPGIMELQAYKGEVNDRTRKIMPLLNDYYKVLKHLPSPENRSSDSTAKRVITVHRKLQVGVIIFTYEEALECFEKAENIAVGVCLDRFIGKLVGRPCDKPMDVCMTLSPDASAIAGRGFGKLISKEEARLILDRAEEAGLIHCSITEPGDTSINFMCHCCLCHCRVMKGVKYSPVPSQAVTSKFVAKIDYEACTGCGMCVDRCNMGALKLDNSTLVQDKDRCIGCGLCRYVCPFDALKMEPR